MTDTETKRLEEIIEFKLTQLFSIRERNPKIIAMRLVHEIKKEFYCDGEHHDQKRAD